MTFSSNSDWVGALLVIKVNPEALNFLERIIIKKPNIPEKGSNRFLGRYYPIVEALRMMLGIRLQIDSHRCTVMNVNDQ